MVEPFPDLSTLSDEQLDALLADLEQAEDAISLRRRLLHGRIDIFRAERVSRLRVRMSDGELDASSLEDHAPERLERPLFEGSGELPAEAQLEPMPDLATVGDEEIRTMILDLEREEDDVSLERRVLQGRIDLLRAERSRRVRGGEWGPDRIAEALLRGGNPTTE